MTIRIDETEYLKQNKALARLLVAVYDNEPVSTRRLLQILHSTHYGYITIRQAEKKRFIKRKRDEKARSVGQPPILNTLTSQGKRLAKMTKELKNS